MIDSSASRAVSATSVYATYLSDIAVRLAYQRRGVGRELIRRTQAEGGPATVFLFAAPQAVDYYARIGFGAGSGWIFAQAKPCVSVSKRGGSAPRRARVGARLAARRLRRYLLPSRPPA